MKTILLSFLGLVVMILLTYFIRIAFVPMQIGEKIVEREVLKNSPQYIITQRQALIVNFKAWSETDSEARKTALEGQMCEIMANIPASEVPTYMKEEFSCN